MTKKHFRSTTAVIAVAASLVCPSLRAGADEPQEKELDSYVLAADAFVPRPVDAKDEIFYATSAKSLEAKLKEYGQTFPDNIHFPDGSLFILVVSDHNNESFDKVSTVASKHEVVVDLSKDADAAPPAAADDKHKTSRLLLIGCQPVKGVKSFAVKTADGVVHDVKATEQKPPAHAR